MAISITSTPIRMINNVRHIIQVASLINGSLDECFHLKLNICYFIFFVTKVDKLLPFQSPTLQSRLSGRFGVSSKCLLQGDGCLGLLHLKHDMCYLLRILGTQGVVYNMFSNLEPHEGDQEG